MLDSLRARFIRWDALRTARLLRQRASERGLRTSLGAGPVGGDASVLFFTTHKAASSLMHRLFVEIAGQARLTWMDYAAGIERRNALLDIPVPFEPFIEAQASRLFEPRGEFHGPLRRPFDFSGREAFRHVFFLRDPRDVLVSAWHSFAVTHPLPSGRAHRRTFIARRRAMQARGMESWTVEQAQTWLRPALETYARFRREAPDSVVLGYDAMRRDPVGFIRDLAALMGADLPDGRVVDLARLIGPSRTARAGSAGLGDVSAPEAPAGSTVPGVAAALPEGHVRSGRTGQWTTEWSPATMRRVDEILGEMLEEWGFEAQARRPAEFSRQLPSA